MVIKIVEQTKKPSVPKARDLKVTERSTRAQQIPRDEQYSRTSGKKKK